MCASNKYEGKLLRRTFPLWGKSTQERHKRFFNGKLPLPVREKYLQLDSRFDTVIAWDGGFPKGMKVSRK